MKLDARLQAVLDFVPAEDCVADIGTDHGYLAVALVTSGRAKHVIASDLNEGPCEAARRTIHENALCEAVTVRRGDGLKVLVPGEVTTVCLAGMGGQLMTSMFEAAPEVYAGLQTLVLQPMNGAYELRKYLYTHGFFLADECLVVAEDKLYTVLCAKRGKRKLPEDILLMIGPVLWEKKPKLLRNHIESLLFLLRRVAAGMAKSEQAKKTERYHNVQNRIRELEARLKW